MQKYKPLPDSLTIKPSTIHGLGLFATQDISEGTCLGQTHRVIDRSLFPKAGVLRTPLGGFYNHSDTPNCEKRDVKINDKLIGFELVTLRDIKKDEEITVKYTLNSIS